MTITLRLACALVVSSLLALNACAPVVEDTGRENATTPASAASGVSCIAVLPVQVSLPAEKILSREEMDALRQGATVMDGILRQKLQGRKNIRFAAQQSGDGDEALLNLERSRQLASRLGCNTLMETVLSRYVEREGGPYGVQQPAALTFSYRLYQADKGNVLCHGRFEERQQSLLENLLAMDKVSARGMTWISAPELAQEGRGRQLEQCRYLGGK